MAATVRSAHYWIHGESAPATIGELNGPRRRRRSERRLRGRPRFGVRGRPRFGRFQVDSEADLGFGEVAVDAAPGSV